MSAKVSQRSATDNPRRSRGVLWDTRHERKVSRHSVADRLRDGVAGYYQDDNLSFSFASGA